MNDTSFIGIAHEIHFNDINDVKPDALELGLTQGDCEERVFGGVCQNFRDIRRVSEITNIISNCPAAETSGRTGHK
jgi:hypothetical protein